MNTTLSLLTTKTRTLTDPALKGNSDDGEGRSSVWYGLRAYSEEPVINEINNTVEHTVYFQPYLNNSNTARTDTQSTQSSNYASFFKVGNETHNFWIKYNLAASTNRESRQYLRDSNSYQFYYQKIDSSNIIDVGPSMGISSGNIGFKYTFTTNFNDISTTDTKIVKTISFKLVPPSEGSEGFRGTNETTVIVELKLPSALKIGAPTISGSADYETGNTKVFRATASNSGANISWKAPTVSASNANKISGYNLRYAISNSIAIPTLSNSISLGNITSLDINNNDFRNILKSMNEGQYLFAAIQTVGTDITVDEYSNVIIFRKNIRPSAPSVTTSNKYYDTSRIVTFTIAAQKGKIDISACVFNFGTSPEITGQEFGTHTYKLPDGTSSVSIYAIDALGDSSSVTTLTFTQQNTNLGINLTPAMAKVVGSYAAVINGFSYTISSGTAPYTIKLFVESSQIGSSQIDSFTSNNTSGTRTFSSAVNVLNKGITRGSDYGIKLQITDATGITKTATTSYTVPALSFDVTATGENKNTSHFNKTITYSFNISSDINNIDSYNILYKDIVLDRSIPSGTFDVSGVSYDASVAFTFRIRDILGLYESKTVTLSRISESYAPPVPQSLEADILSSYVLKPLSKSLLESINKKDTAIIFDWFAPHAGIYKIYVAFGSYELEVASIKLNAANNKASSTIYINEDFFAEFSDIETTLINTYKNSNVSGQFRMYGYNDDYGYSDTYATATTNSGNTLNFSVSFQEAPYFALEAEITDVKIDSIYGQPTIPNPGDTITLNFPKANDYNGNEISYRIYEEIYEKISDDNKNLIGSFYYEPTITITEKGVTASFEISDNIYENNEYLIKVEPYTNYGYGTPLSYKYDYKGRVTNPTFEVVSSSVNSSKELIINCKITDWGGINKSKNNFRSNFAYAIYADTMNKGSTSSETFSIEVADYTTSTNTVIKLDGYADSDNPLLQQQQVTSSLSYIHYLAEPTVAYRKNYLGINTSSPEGKDVIIDIHAYNSYEKIKLVGPEKTITINLSDGSIDGAIISGGEWS